MVGRNSQVVAEIASGGENPDSLLTTSADYYLGLTFR